MKERLTGAAILVALIVLLVPELLHGPVRPVAHPVAAAEGAPPFRTVDINVGDDAHAHGVATPAASSAQQPAPLAASTEPGPKAPEPAVAAPAAPAARPAPAPAPPAEHPLSAQPAPAESLPSDAATSGAFMVQLGSFASRDNADRLAKQVKSQGFAVSVVRGNSGRHLYKVLVGPAHDHAAALELEGKLHAAGHSGSIVAK